MSVVNWPVPRAGTKSNGYENYLFYKKLLEIIGAGDCGRREVAATMELQPSQVWHGIRVLKKANAIKVCRYEVSRSSKREIFALVK